VDLFAFAGWVVAVVSLITIAWPLNIPVMALAYRVRRGSEPLDLEPYEFWVRATVASVGLAGMAVVLQVLSYLLIREIGLPGGATLLVLILAYLPAAVAYVYWAFGFDEMVDSLAVLLLYILLPAVPLLLVGWLLGLWRVLAQAAPWLFPSP
jgi:hypothetical protein